MKIGDLAYLIVDCRDVEKVAGFWGKLLGLEISNHSHPYLDLMPARPEGPTLSFQQVSEPKMGKNRLHMDIKVEDLDAAWSQIELLGGRLTKKCTEGKWQWYVMADPEGNEFCLVLG